MTNETWRPVEDGEYEAQHTSDSYIIEGECLTVQELIAGSGDTQVATIALPDDRRICRRVEEPRYPELDASVEAGDELDAWRERCHALEAENAQQLELLLEANALIIKRLKLDEHLEAENARLRALLPDAETRKAIKNATEFARETDEDIIWSWLDNLESKEP